MALRIRKFSLANLFSIDWWKCSFKYFRGIKKMSKGHYTSANDDLYWILNNGALRNIECVIYETLGENYARLKNFNKAEYFLLKSLEDNSQSKNGYLFMWLGYVFLVKEKHEEALNYFRKAQKYSQKGIYQLVAQHEYVKERIDGLEESIKEKYKEIITEN